ncbi:MAG: hypothetical protein Q8K36_07225 [Alphaproteobacteria bacterium]|nr:hypothetical protein [Alphaproteobacteria bacterium]
MFHEENEQYKQMTLDGHMENMDRHLNAQHLHQLHQEHMHQIHVHQQRQMQMTHEIEK